MTSALATLATLLPQLVAATTMLAASPEQLTDASELIIVAEPLSQQSRWEGGRIVTDTEVELREVLAAKSAPPALGAHLTITTLGGVVGDVGQFVPGAARIELGQTHVLFLSRTGTALRPVRLFQGVFRVEPAAGALLLRRPTPTDRVLTESSGAPGFPTTLDGLRRFLRERSHGR